MTHEQYDMFGLIESTLPKDKYVVVNAENSSTDVEFFVYETKADLYVDFYKIKHPLYPGHAWVPRNTATSHTLMDYVDCIIGNEEFSLRSHDLVVYFLGITQN